MQVCAGGPEGSLRPGLPPQVRVSFLAVRPGPASLHGWSWHALPRQPSCPTAIRTEPSQCWTKSGGTITVFATETGTGDSTPGKEERITADQSTHHCPFPMKAPPEGLSLFPDFGQKENDPKSRPGQPGFGTLQDDELKHGGRGLRLQRCHSPALANANCRDELRPALFEAVCDADHRGGGTIYGGGNHP